MTETNAPDVRSAELPEIHFERSSVVDPIGRVAHGDNRVFRVIEDEYADRTLGILDVAEKQRWFDHHLVATWVARERRPGSRLVLEHRKLPFVTQRGEWSFAGLKAAALCHLRLCRLMMQSGYCIKDAHTWNVLFDGPKPIFIDFGSIVEFRGFDEKFWLSEFFRFYWAPLQLFAAGRAGLARSLTQEHVHGAGLWLLTHEPDRLARMPSIDRMTPETLGELSGLVEDLSFPSQGGDWHSYMPDDQALREKDIKIAEILTTMTFSTVIDIGANIGVHARMCAEQGADVLACDIEEDVLNRLFSKTEQEIQRITPLYLDLTLPLGTGGVFCTQPASSERLRCDLVIALALVHHVCFRKRYHVDVVVGAIAAFTRGAALIEFVPDDDEHVRGWNLAPLPNYSVDGFREELRRHFRSVVDIPFSIEPRRLFICKGKIERSI